jgi:acetyl-CoA C-acetyltransferase
VATLKLLLLVDGKHEFSSALYAFENCKFGPTSMVDGLQKMGLLMLMTTMQWGCADLCAAEYKFTREDQDNTQCNRMTVLQKLGKLVNLTMKYSCSGSTKKGDPIMVSKDEEFTNVKWTVFHH